MNVKTKKLLICAFAIIMLVCVVFISCILDDCSSFDRLRFVLETESVNEKISLFEQDNQYYLFLPAYADYDQMRIECDSFCSVIIDGICYSAHDNLSSLKRTDNEQHILEIKGSLGGEICEKPLFIMQAENIPALSIHLLDGTINDINNDKDKEIKNGSCSLIENDKRIVYYGDISSFHGRGNSSWAQQKKPYAIEFSDNVDLLGTGGNKNWVLIANAMDESNLRDKIVYDFARDVGLEYSVNSKFVDLYIDEEYYGLYLLSEKIEVSDNRIDISKLYETTQDKNHYKLKSYDKVSYIDDDIFQKAFLIPNNPKDITGGYLVEFELANRVGDENNLFTTKSKQSMTVKYPKYASVQEMQYVSTFFQTIENNLGNESITELIDLTSWAKYYLVQEVFANVSHTSFFFYKDSDSIDGKVYAGPIWDFDLSLGTSYNAENSSPYKFYVNTWGWFERLYGNDLFRAAIEREYKDCFRGRLQTIISDTIDIYEEQIAQSYKMNEVRWSAIQQLWWVNRYATLKEHSSFLKKFLNNRIAFLDSEWVYHEMGKYYTEYNAEEVLANEALIKEDTVVPPDDQTENKERNSEQQMDILSMLITEIAEHRTFVLTCGVCLVFGLFGLFFLVADIRKNKSSGER